MRVIRTRGELRDELAGPRRESKRIGLVPTMGALHDGHVSLLRAAREGCDVVVMSLFVNPKQFGEAADLAAYPRDEEHDVALATEAGVDFIYAPAAEEVYPEGFATRVEVDSRLTSVLEADPEQRGPEHFRGVTTVVAKLFNTVQPHVAFFGQKDAQQALVIRQMTSDLDFPVEIAVLPTVREPSGLAMSSRNSYLSEAELEQAAALSRALRNAAALAESGERSTHAALDAARSELEAAGVSPEYLEARYADDLSPAQSFNGRPVLIALAARVGKARLIDNVLIGDPE
jgi:pantoate--beta-alanine ligase